ncbi:MMPL family transporter [Antrihabitans sp. YC2-6]|uniref:MMPL family transporter n=1 Tax=Antrihabitans sp. YC2-6 TaxID=2799498 RepID=UPI0018F6031D|nr:MMPL family transporter [Antrihabitans sp. YC2-6]MBJ8344407.1 MMPL family transporter [Antrihabitans sp. YC2-6]
MSTFLFRLSRAAFDEWWYFLASWVIAVTHIVGILVAVRAPIFGDLPDFGAPVLVPAAVILLASFVWVISAGLPPTAAFSGRAVGLGVAIAMSLIPEMQSTTAVAALIIGLALGIDYTLLVLFRQRRLVHDAGLDPSEAVGRAIGASSGAVFVGGAAALIALLAVSVVSHSTLMATAIAAGAVVTAILGAFTLLPALLGMVGGRLHARQEPGKRPANSGNL